MTPTPCRYENGCVRSAGHRGGHTLWPHPATWDFDLNHELEVEAAVTLLALDFPTPPWADLLD